MKPQILSPREAVKLIPSDCTLLTEGFVGACFAEELAIALEKRFLESGAPEALPWFMQPGREMASIGGLTI